MAAGWKNVEQREARRKAAQRSTIMKWTVAVAVLAAIGYGLSQMSGVAYTDRDITAVNFSGLSRSEKKTALQAANQARCPCTCGMSLAQCVATDSTCPVREDNIGRIKTMVDQAMTPRPVS